MQLTAHRIGIGMIAGVTVAMIACSSASTLVDRDGFGVGGGRGVGPSGSTSTGTVTPVPESTCPSDPPKEGDLCSPVVVTGCGYGPDFRDECNVTYDCGSRGRWEKHVEACASDCPKTMDAIVPGTACPDSAVACNYEEGSCACVGEGEPLSPDPALDAGAGDASTDGGDAGDGGYTKPLVPGVWKCVGPPTSFACPSTRPRELDPCVKSVTCDYGTCELGRPLSYYCTGGQWQRGFEPSCD